MTLDELYTLKEVLSNSYISMGEGFGPYYESLKEDKAKSIKAVNNEIRKIKNENQTNKEQRLRKAI